MPTEARTPTRGESFDQQGLGLAATAESNDVSPSADGVTDADHRPRTPTPVTPALTGNTDDSDTDFQSAYSSSPSPRESIRGDFDDNTAVSSIVFHAKEKPDPGSFDAGIVRARVSSIEALAQPSPTFSDDTVVSSTVVRR